MAAFARPSLNAPTGAWCSLTGCGHGRSYILDGSQCTYRCVVLPDPFQPDDHLQNCGSQCTYRCVVLPDRKKELRDMINAFVSMHLQVRGAP